jgi:hypothetical protein
VQSQSPFERHFQKPGYTVGLHSGVHSVHTRKSGASVGERMSKGGGSESKYRENIVQGSIISRQN